MPRPPRIDYPGAWHQVYSRGNRRQRLFHAERDYQIYMATLAKVASSVSWRIHGYVLMPNHTHLVIETPTATLSRGMKRLNESYAARFNSAYHLDGHVFQGRFGSKLIDGDEQLGRVLWYLAMNPVEAGLCSDPAAYRWSSYAAISGRAPMQPFLQPDIARHVLARTPPAPSLDRLLDAGTDEAIRQAQAAGYTVRSIASHLGVGVATVSRRLKRNNGV